MENKLKIKIAMVSIMLSIAFTFAAYSQGNIEYSELKSYRNWGIIGGPVLFNKATITPQYGDYTISTKPMLGYNVGIEYNFYQANKWSFMTGLITSIEPLYNFDCRINKQDLYSGYENDITEKFTNYTMNSFSAPLIVKLNIQAHRKLFINVLTGLKVTYLQSGKADVSMHIVNDDLTEMREVFGYRVKSPDNSFQGAYVIGIGSSIALNKILLKSNLIYVMNFQNVISGEYLFGNLMQSSGSRGYYDLSGNYLGLMFSVSLKKSKRHL